MILSHLYSFLWIKQEEHSLSISEKKKKHSLSLVQPIHPAHSLLFRTRPAQRLLPAQPTGSSWEPRWARPTPAISPMVARSLVALSTLAYSPTSPAHADGFRWSTTTLECPRRHAWRPVVIQWSHTDQNRTVEVKGGHERQQGHTMSTTTYSADTEL
jgi:hypothetical protein